MPRQTVKDDTFKVYNEYGYVTRTWHASSIEPLSVLSADLSVITDIELESTNRDDQKNWFMRIILFNRDESPDTRHY